MTRLAPYRRALPLLLLVAAAPLGAQSPDAATMKGDWERAKRTFLAYVDAMPDSAMGFRATPGVRTFAEQIVHAVGYNYQIAQLGLRGERSPRLPGDSAQYLHRKAALRAFTVATFDGVLSALAAATPAQLAKPMPLFNQPPQPVSRWLQLSYEHATWTLGQTVPYLRMNKVTPPDYEIPF